MAYRTLFALALAAVFIAVGCAIDSDGGYSYKSGRALAICNNSGNMSGENYACSNFSSVGIKSTVSASSGAYLTAGSLAIKMPASVSGIAVYLSGSSSGSISTSSSTSLSQLVGNLYG